MDHNLYNNVSAINLRFAARIFAISLATVAFGVAADDGQLSQKSLKIEGRETVGASENDPENPQLCIGIREKLVTGIEKFQYVEAAGARWTIVFEDNSISETLKRDIAKDLALIIGRFSEYDLVEANSNRIFDVGGCEIGSIGYLDFSVSGNYFVPDSFIGNFGDVIKLEEMDYLIVSRKIVQSYKKSMILREKYREKFRKLYELVEFVNGAVKMNKGQIESLFYFERIAVRRKEAIITSMLSGGGNPFGRNRLLPPSLLDVSTPDAEDGVQAVLKSNLLLRDTKSRDIVQEISVIYTSDGWRIIVPGG